MIHYSNTQRGSCFDLPALHWKSFCAEEQLQVALITNIWKRSTNATLHYIEAGLQSNGQTSKIIINISIWILQFYTYKQETDFKCCTQAL